MGKYECGYCGKSYDKIEERTKCEAKCCEQEARKKNIEDISIMRKKLEGLLKQRKDLKEKIDVLDKRIIDTQNALSRIHGVDDKHVCHCVSDTDELRDLIGILFGKGI